MTANPKLIKDLDNDFFQLEAHRAYIEINRADSNSTKTTLRDKNYLKEARQVSFTHSSDAYLTIYVTLIPVYSQHVPANKAVFLATVEIYIAANKSGVVDTGLAAYPPRRLLASSGSEAGVSIYPTTGKIIYTNPYSHEVGLSISYLTDVEV